MYRYRIAIVLFVLGATVANAFAYAHSIAAISPYGPDLLESHFVAAAKDMFCLREAIILTVAAVTWFVLPKA
jgi:hypothetical protein